MLIQDNNEENIRLHSVPEHATTFDRNRKSMDNRVGMNPYYTRKNIPSASRGYALGTIISNQSSV